MRPLIFFIVMVFFATAGFEGQADGSDAAVLADRILSPGSDDQKRFDLIRELEEVLTRIRNAYPAMSNIHARRSYVPGVLLIGITPELKKAIQSSIGGKWGPAPQDTGYADFDALNTRFGLRKIRSSTRANTATLTFDAGLNIRAAIAAYLALKEVRYAVPDRIIGDGPDIDVFREGETWYVIFRNAWGDCPSGCINEESFYFAVSGGNVTQIDDTHPVFSGPTRLRKRK